MDIRDFIKIPNSELPEELLNLDILDGSPPCSVISIIALSITNTLSNVINIPPFYLTK